MRQKNFLWYILGGILIFVAGIYLLGLSSKSENLNYVPNQSLDQQVKILKDTQIEISQFKEKVTLANKIVEKNKSEINELKIKDKSQKAQIEKLNQALNENQTKYEDLKKDLDNAKLADKVTIQEKRIDIQKLIDRTKDQIRTIENSELETKLSLTQKEAVQKAAIINATETQQTLSQKSEMLSNELNTIVNGTLALFQSYAIFFVLLIVYWLVYKVLISWLSKDIGNYSLRSGLKLTFRILWLLISGITLIYALGGQFSYILTSLGFVSAALVFALQNFVASFFVFILLSFTKNIKSGDIVKVGPDGEKSFGKIVKIGYLFTLMREIDPETFEEAGRTISIPNNYFLTHPISNFTFVNRVVWQTLEITVTKNSDYSLCKKILTELANQKYELMVQKKLEYLDYEVDIEMFRPKVFMSLGDRGFLFTVHFPSQFSQYNEISDQLLIEIMKEFEKNKIELSFV